MRPQCGVAGGARATEEEGEPVGGEQNAAAEAAGTAAGAGAGAVPGSRLLYRRILHCSRCTAHYNPALLEWRGTYVCASTRARRSLRRGCGASTRERALQRLKAYASAFPFTSF